MYILSALNMISVCQHANSAAMPSVCGPGVCTVVHCSKASRVMFYKVPFSAVPDLVARRQVLLRDGFAYVREAQVCGVCGSILPMRRHGECSVAKACQALHCSPRLSSTWLSR